MILTLASTFLATRKTRQDKKIPASPADQMWKKGKAGCWSALMGDQGNCQARSWPLLHTELSRTRYKRLGSCRGTYRTRSVRSSVFAVSNRLYCRRHAATSSESTAHLWNDNTAALQPVTDWCQTASRAPDTLRKQADSDLLQQPQVSWQWP